MILSFKTLCPVIGAALLILPTLPLAAGQVTLNPSKDNTLYDSKDDLSNGAGIYLFAGNTDGNGLRRAVLAFDVSGIPAGSTIESVELNLTMNMTIAGSEDMNLHRLINDWGEGTSDASGQEGGGAAATAGDATWRDRFFGVASWNSNGGDFDMSASATQAVAGNGVYTWGSNSMMVADVQGWVDDGSTNFGWILLGDEGNTATAKRFGSRENKDAPELLVTFTAPSADLGITIDDFRQAVQEGNSLTYTVTVTNAGPDDVTGATVNVTFPAPLTDCEWTCVETMGSCTNGPVIGDIADLVDLASGGRLVYTATCNVPKEAANDPIMTTATVDGPASPADPNAANDSDTDTTDIGFFMDRFETGDFTAWSTVVP